MSKIFRSVRKPFTNTRTNTLHSAWVTTAVGWTIVLLVKFSVVEPDFFDATTVGAIVGLIGLIQMFWRTYFKK